MRLLECCGGLTIGGFLTSEVGYWELYGGRVATARFVVFNVISFI